MIGFARCAASRRRRGPATEPAVEGEAMARILCVDDELGLRRLLRRVLEPEGHAVSTALDGITALRMACAQDWDLIILDLLLPDLPGTAVLSAMIENKPEQRVLVLSALG